MLLLTMFVTGQPSVFTLGIYDALNNTSSVGFPQARRVLKGILSKFVNFFACNKEYDDLT